MTRRRAIILGAAATAIGWFFTACGARSAGKCTTEKTMSQERLRTLFPYRPDLTVITADTTYSEVNPAFAEEWHDWMGKVMSFLGASSRWNERFDCNRFVTVKLAVIQVRYLVDTWQSWVAGQAPAAAECHYLAQGTGGLRGGHATIATVENGAVVYRDVYSARVLPLTEAEKASIWLVRF